MSLLHFEAHTDANQVNAGQSRSIAVGNVATNGAVSFTPFINYSITETYDILLAGTVAVTNTTNCTVTNGTLEMGRSRLITPSPSTGPFSATFTITHDTEPDSPTPTGEPSALYLAYAAGYEAVQALQTTFPNAYSALGGNNPATGDPWLDVNGTGTVTALDQLEFMRYPNGTHASANTARIEAALAQLQANINTVEAYMQYVPKLYPQVVKTYVVSGTVVYPPDYGLQVFNPAGEIRLDFSKKNLRLNSVIVGQVAYSSGWPSTHDVNITGLGYPSAAEWAVIQVNASSIYNVSGILTSATSATSNGVLRLARAATGSFTWAANFSGSLPPAYHIFDDVDPSFQLAVYRV